MIAFALVPDDEAQPLHVEVTTRPRGRQLLAQLYYTCTCTCVPSIQQIFFLFSVKVDHLDLYIKIKKIIHAELKRQKY